MKIFQSLISRYLRLSVAIISAIALVSCDDFFNPEDVKHAAGDDNQWIKLEDTRSGLMGVYAATRAALADNNMYWLAGELRCGDFVASRRADLQAVIANDLNRNHELIEKASDWRRFYSAINAASVFIEKAPGIIGKDLAYSEQNLKYDIAQCRALRAFLYFYMARVWGDVPLITYSYDNGSFPAVARTDQKIVLAYVMNELALAIKDLPFLYGTDSNKYYGEEESYWRGKLINKLSAYAIMAHVAAYLGIYSDVEVYTSYVLDNLSSANIDKTFTSVETLIAANGLFSSNEANSSRLLSFNFMGGAYGEDTQGGHIEQWTLMQPYVQKGYSDIYVPLNHIKEIYTSTSDLRFGIDSETLNYNNIYFDVTTGTPIFKKINIVQTPSATTTDLGIFSSTILVTRPEDMLLLNAEALAVLNRPDESLAMLNTLRNERGLTTLIYKKDLNGNVLNLISEIFSERRRELIGEGHRWFDLIRQQRILHDNPDIQELIDNGGIFWPVSESVLRNNRNILQNSYWK